MICPEKVQELCLFGMMCPREAIVDDDSECAPYIRRVLAMLEGVEPAQVDPVEDAELEQEREAIQGESDPGLMWDEAPRLCRILHRLGSRSPSAVMAGCKLGLRAVFRRGDCSRCPEYVNYGRLILEGFRDGVRAMQHGAEAGGRSEKEV